MIRVCRWSLKFAPIFNGPAAIFNVQFSSCFPPQPTNETADSGRRAANSGKYAH
jgi:hypothetical protein